MEVLASPALVFSILAICAVALVAVLAFNFALSRSEAEAQAKLNEAVEITAANIDNSLKHAEDVLLHLSRSIEVYGPGLVSEDLDPRLALGSSERSYRGLSVWSPYADMVVSTDPNHVNYDLRPLLERFTTSDVAIRNPVVVNQPLQSDSPASPDSNHSILLALSLYEREEFVGVSLIEISTPHLIEELQSLRRKTGIALRLFHDDMEISPLVDAPTPDQPGTTKTQAVVFAKQLQYGFSVLADYDPVAVRARAIQSLDWMMYLAAFFGLALTAFAGLLFNRENNLRRAKHDAETHAISESRAREEAETLLAGLQVLSAKDSEDELYADILSIIADVVAFEDAAILLQEDTGHLNSVATWSNAPQTEQPKPSPVFQRVLNGESIILSGCSEPDPAISRLFDQVAYGSALLVPLQVGIQHACIVCIHSAQDAFEENHLSALSRFAPLAAQVVKRTEHIRQLRVTVERLDYVAHHDGLTGLANRTLFVETLHDQLFDHQVGAFALLQLDLDKFKAINDSMGHAAGDFLLSVVAKRISQSIRSNDFCARLGGDEFAVILSGTNDTKAIASVAQKILKEIQKPLNYKGRTLLPGSSIGISVFPEDGRSAEALLNAADLALYTAKSDGRSCYSFFSGELRQEMERTHIVEANLRDAIQAERLELHYQPIADLKSGEIRAFEALLRYRNSNGEIIAPVEFLKVAECASLMPVITQWVVKQACTEMSVWLRAAPGRRVAINLSGSDVVAPDLIEMLTSTISSYGLSPTCFELELNEQITSERLLESALANLQKLHSDGYSIAFDDFGTGYTSLKHLRCFSGHRLKLDKSLIHGIEDNKANQALVRSLVDLSTSLNLKTVAEGIETQKQFQLCRELGCDEGQGYLIGRPQETLDHKNTTAFQHRA